jgi:hypothetical protein
MFRDGARRLLHCKAADALRSGMFIDASSVLSEQKATTLCFTDWVQAKGFLMCILKCIGLGR